MKTRLIFTLLYIAVLQVSGQVDCSYCNVALAKDVINTSSDFTQVLHSLNIIDKRSYEEMSSKGEWGGGLDILKILGLKANSSWDEFKSKRDELFQKNSFSSTISNSFKEVKTVTADMAYSAWTECLRLCNESDKKRAAAYITIEKANKEYISIKVTYYIGSENTTAQTSIGGTISVMNGAIQDINSLKWKEKLAFKIQRSDAPKTFIIKRKSISKDVVINVNSPQLTYSEFNRYKDPSPYTNTGLWINGSKTVTEPRFDHWVEKTEATDDLHNVRCNDQKCKDLGGRRTCRGGDDGFCWGAHRIDLPQLPDGQWYAAPNSLDVVTDNDGSWGWNKIAGINEKHHLNGRNASVTYETSSRQITTIWKVQAWTNVSYPVPVKEEVKITGNYLTIEVPQGLYDITMKYDKDGNSVIFKLGDDSPDGKLKFLNKSDDGRFFGYFLNYVRQTEPR